MRHILKIFIVLSICTYALLSFERTAASSLNNHSFRYDSAEYLNVYKLKNKRETQMKLQGSKRPVVDFQNDDDRLSPRASKGFGKLLLALISLIVWIFSKLKRTNKDNQDSSTATVESGSDEITNDH